MLVEEKYMYRCLELAQSGKCMVSPNPMVGAVIVFNDQIIGEGFHRKYGEAHAEVEAIRAVKQQDLLSKSTLYVNLEPCSHHGKTPPCADLIIEKRIPRVVVGCLDPFPKVSGKGVQKLRDAGVEVVTHVALREAVELNRFFLTAHQKKRPFIILKWAQSLDGYVDGIREDTSTKPIQLSNFTTRRYVHKLRSEVSAIMVGTNTALLDNPSLSVRHWVGKPPVRILIDRCLKVPSLYQILDGSIDTLVFTDKKHANREKVEYLQIDFSDPIIPQILDVLYHRNIHSLLVEGGPCLQQNLLDTQMCDELRIETAPVFIGQGVKAPVFKIGQKWAKKQSPDLFVNRKFRGNEPLISVYCCNKCE